jgi:alkanesulfonate monooxygenase SsuD/methylene tetrahydromethanopterin reductase-like flavin-dependent oxidoreductase (luciferase family)
VIIGGTGLRRTPRLAALYADEYNVAFQPVKETAAAFDRVRVACEVAERTDRPMQYSVAHTVCCGRTDEELQRRAEAIGRPLASLREAGLAGSPAEIVEQIGAYAELGAERVYLQVLDLHDLGHLELLASKVMPQVS